MMTDGTTSILLAGVGGQGIIRASDILSEVMIEVGYDIKKSEVHGMAQRGGCVSSHVRYGKKVYSPLAKKGDVDILLSFEKVETVRYLDYLKLQGKVIVNDVEIYPPSVNLGETLYPKNIVDEIRLHIKDVKEVNSSALAFQAGNPRAANTALLGVLSIYLDIEVELWERVLRRSFPLKAIEANIAAFELGRSA